MPAPQKVTLVSAAPAQPGHLTVAMVVDGHQQVFGMPAHVAAVLSSDIVRALGNSLLYDAGLERAAQVVALATTEDISADPRDDLERLAMEIRECKIGRKI